MQLLTLVPLIVPPFISAIFFSALLIEIGVYSRFVGILIGHTVSYLPYAIRLLTVSFAMVRQDLVDAARDLGASPLTVFRTAYLPVLKPGLLAALIIVFILSIEEFAISYIVGAPDFITVPTILYSYLGYNFIRPNAAAVSLILVVPTSFDADCRTPFEKRGSGRCDRQGMMSIPSNNSTNQGPDAMFRKLALLMLATALPLAAIQTPAKAKDLSQMNWEEIVAQAKAEGKINWFHWYFQDRFREQVKTFEAEYGIKVSIPDGDSKPISTSCWPNAAAQKGTSMSFRSAVRCHRPSRQKKFSMGH